MANSARTYQKGEGPSAVVEPHLVSRLSNGRQIGWDLVPDSYRSDAWQITATAVAAIAATSITVSALTKDIPKGTVLNFGGNKYATLSATALAGATSISVNALVAAIAISDVAQGPASEAKHIPAETFVVEVGADKVLVPRAARPGSETSIGLLIGPATEGDLQQARSGHGVYRAGQIYKELLPEVRAGLSAPNFTTYSGEVPALVFVKFGDNS